MISKDKDPLASRSGVDLASHQAQVRLANYLNEEFESDPDIHVFNQVYLLRDDQPVQLDHLLLHQHGFILIDSHSLVGDFLVDKRGRFTLRGRMDEDGVPVSEDEQVHILSPIDRTKVLGELTKGMLRGNASHLFEGETDLIDRCPVDVMVAVADQSIVRFEGEKPSEIYNADFIQYAARELIQRRQRASRDKEKHGEDEAGSFSPNQMEQIGFFIIAEHESIAQPGLVLPEDHHSSAIPALVEQPAPDDSGGFEPSLERPCPRCGSTRQKIVHGRYCYQFLCDGCGEKSMVNANCPTCGQKAHIRRTPQKEFFLQCPTCETSRLFYVNPKM